MAEAIVDMRPQLPASPAEFRAFESGDIINTSGIRSLSSIDIARVRAADAGITINVNAPSIIDQEGFSRAMVDALNQSANRGTGGGGGIRDTAQIL